MPAETKPKYSVYMNDVEIAAFGRGREQGIEQGIEKGIEQGVHSGAFRLTFRQLEGKFGTIEEALRSRIETLPIEKLEDLGVALLNFQTIEELQNWLNANT